MVKVRKKPGRKPGVKVGPYKKLMSIKEMFNDIKELKARMAKLEKVLS
jgi:hypothetical protein